MTNSYSFVCVLCLATLVTTLGVNAQGTLEVHRTTRDIDTVLGCSENIICEGPADKIEWQLGKRKVITNKNITTTDGNLVRSYLSLTHVSPLDANTYTCLVKRGAVTLNVDTRVTVSDTIVVVDPIEDIDISARTVGDTLSVECRARTCHKNVTVSIMTGGQLIVHKEFPYGGWISVVGEVEILADTAGGGVCQVSLPDGTVFPERFRITGTPLGVPSPIPEADDNGSPIEERSSWSTSSVRGSSGNNVPCVQVMAMMLMFVATILYI